MTKAYGQSSKKCHWPWSMTKKLSLTMVNDKKNCHWLKVIYIGKANDFLNTFLFFLYELCQLFILFTKSAFFCVTVPLWLKKIPWSTSYMKQFLCRCNRMIYLVAALQFQRHDQYHVDFAVENEGIAIPKTNKKCREGVCRDWVTAVTESLGKPVIGGGRLVGGPSTPDRSNINPLIPSPSCSYIASTLRCTE